MKTVPKSRAKTAYGLLDAVVKAVTEEPKRLRMGVVCLRGASLQSAWRYEKPYKRPACGAVGCIAGWALTLKGLTGENENNGSDLAQASNLLGLNTQQTDDLFWPSHLVSASNQQTRAHVRDTVKHIREFQAKHATQLKSTKV